ncbi:hypothetical protein QBC47DRAFT_356660 [Echria macrotheca]|uniref:Uncharacterized protein n=1 Tax=Echria macrotheca TaxID=438768 RepID=A0AAJ0FHZ6_9PEZI|nr:hypothetical protein QBC47DRAFT_356660 [Echria macrotheca]
MSLKSLFAAALLLPGVLGAALPNTDIANEVEVVDKRTAEAIIAGLVGHKAAEAVVEVTEETGAPMGVVMAMAGRVDKADKLDKVLRVDNMKAEEARADKADRVNKVGVNKAAASKDRPRPVKVEVEDSPSHLASRAKAVDSQCSLASLVRVVVDNPRPAEGAEAELPQQVPLVGQLRLPSPPVVHRLLVPQREDPLRSAEEAARLLLGPRGAHFHRVEVPSVEVLEALRTAAHPVAPSAVTLQGAVSGAVVLLAGGHPKVKVVVVGVEAAAAVREEARAEVKGEVAEEAGVEAEGRVLGHSPFRPVLSRLNPCLSRQSHLGRPRGRERERQRKGRRQEQG